VAQAVETEAGLRTAGTSGFTQDSLTYFEIWVSVDNDRRRAVKDCQYPSLRDVGFFAARVSTSFAPSKNSAPAALSAAN